ncbi:MAG: NAD(+)/NADH kinase [Planctomycetota bacterium]|nr:NAD(+)/NADH kinase [Planctomycetota bacterium]
MTSARRRVLIVGDRRRPGVADGVRRHRARLAERVEVVGEDLDERIDLAKAEADLVLVFGGDGSILHVARRLGTNPIPVLGVNYGRFGFLADLAPEQLDEGIDRWLEGAAELHRRTRLDVTWLRSDGVGGRWLALNDVVVGRSELGRMVDVDVGIDGHHAIRFSGDGLILASPTGSSAHAVAAGGPLLDPTIEAIVMVPIAPHSLSTRPLVLSGRHVFRLTVAESRTPATFTVDGAEAVSLGPDDAIEVAKSTSPLTLVRVFGGPFYETLRRKLGWRGRPYYPTDPEPPVEDEA